jgi:DNA polymerase-1
VKRYRKARKITSTYLRRFDPRAADTYVYPDGLIHCRYKTAFTKTSRFACEDPNNQNWPKRDPVAKRVRRMVQMRGHSIVACDLGQGEARVIAMHSRDKTLCRALRTNYDIHLEWAEKVASAWPKALSAVDNDMKRLRTGIKNQLVFPAFYGASVKRIAKELHLPESVAEELFEEFWQQFKGVRAWQRTLLQEYKEYGYVTSLTGRRRHGPMGYNDIINSPIQAACSDILIDGIDALVRRSIEEDKPYLMPALNIHDDATTWTPNKYVDEVLAIMVEEMLRKRYDWQCVPLTVELECGPDWYNMKPIGTFRSDEL